MIFSSSLIGREATWYEDGSSRTVTVVSVGYSAICTQAGYATNHHWRILAVDEDGYLGEGPISEFRIMPLKENKMEDPYRPNPR